jgi:hypothetical protein
MYISKETLAQTEKRLLKVLSKAELVVFDGAYTFEEFPISELKSKAKDTALAFVRDEEVWSQLIPSQDTTKELFKIIGFHFPKGLDNSGFVGWLATHLKQKLGTGVFVTCGQNSSRGGIFDYWGCPYEIGESFIEEIVSLIEHFV